MSSYFSSVYSLFDKSFPNRSADINRPKSPATGSIAVVKCGYDQLYYDENSLQNTSDISSDDDHDSTYCFIDNFKSLPLTKLLSLDDLSESFSGSDEDIISEFTILLPRIKYICHSLDTSTVSTQFADTDVVIGDKLKDMIQFICNRYHQVQTVGDSGVAFLALLLLANQVLETVPEVKNQLLYKTFIGRDIILNMVMVLGIPKNEINTPRMVYDQTEFSRILYGISDSKILQGLPEMIDVLTEISTRFATLDKGWVLFEKYATVVTLADEFFKY